MQTRQRARVVGVARLAARDGHGGEPPRPAAGRARLHDRGHAAFRRARTPTAAARRSRRWRCRGTRCMRARRCARCSPRWRPGWPRAGAAREPRADARPRHAGGRRGGDAGRHPRPALCRHPHGRAPSRTSPCCRRARSGAIPSSCRGWTGTGWRWRGCGRCRWPCRARAYTGWNPRAEGFGAGALYPLQGAVVPLGRHAGGAAGGGRPAPVPRGALRGRCGLRRRGASGRRRRRWPSGCCCPRTRHGWSRGRGRRGRGRRPAEAGGAAVRGRRASGARGQGPGARGRGRGSGAGVQGGGVPDRHLLARDDADGLEVALVEAELGELVGRAVQPARELAGVGRALVGGPGRASPRGGA